MGDSAMASRPLLHPSFVDQVHFSFSTRQLSFSNSKARNKSRVVYASSSKLCDCDVVVIGAGIIGLSIANRLLHDSNLSVSVVDSAPGTCAGATGAGQGYIWLGHRDPESSSWPFAQRGKHLWDEFAQKIKISGLDPLTTIGWKETGSLLVTTTAEKASALFERSKKLSNAGLQVEYLDAKAARKEEPALAIREEGAACLVHGDRQIDARLAVQYIQEENRSLGNGRYREFFDNPVTDFSWSSSENYLKGVKTSNGMIHANRATIVAAGAWSPNLMEILAKRFDKALKPPMQPRKGHLLVLKGSPDLQLSHGLMELDYIFKAHTPSNKNDGDLSIAMTATLDATGNLLLGSSRQFKGFDITPETLVIHDMILHAAKFLPNLLRSFGALQNVHPRTGLRPYITGDKPVIGAVKEVPGLYLASGHEGEGLSLALATAEMISHMIMETGKDVIDPLLYSPAGRLI